MIKTEDLKKRRELILKTIEAIENKLHLFPDGNIKIKKRKSGVYYYLSTEENDDQLLHEDDKELIQLMVQKGYLKKELVLLKAELKSIDRIKQVYPNMVAEELYDHLSDERKQFVTPINMGNEEYARKWLEKPYAHKPFKQGDPYYKTLRGERVRSKSEVIIADRLYANGIPYKYECPVKVGNKTIHPDFSILRLSDLKIVYHEHCGMLDDAKYTEDMVRRINDYSDEGIILGDRLFLSFETSNKPLDVRTIDKLIYRHFR